MNEFDVVEITKGLVELGDADVVKSFESVGAVTDGALAFVVMILSRIESSLWVSGVDLCPDGEEE